MVEEDKEALKLYIDLFISFFKKEAPLERSNFLQSFKDAKKKLFKNFDSKNLAKLDKFFPNENVISCLTPSNGFQRTVLLNMKKNIYIVDGWSELKFTE